jgi:hypothetical protein
MDGLQKSVDNLGSQVGFLTNKLAAMSPGDVVTVGIPQRPSVVTDAVHSEYSIGNQKLDSVLRGAAAR